MPFNFDKCKIMHSGSKKSKYRYNMHGKSLRAVNEKSDVGITIILNRKPQNCRTAWKKANTILEFISRSFVRKTSEVLLIMHNSLGRPHLEY